MRYDSCHLDAFCYKCRQDDFQPQTLNADRQTDCAPLRDMQTEIQTGQLNNSTQRRNKCNSLDQDKMSTCL